jgi:large conductance mechanosensitive channel
MALSRIHLPADEHPANPKKTSARSSLEDKLSLFDEFKKFAFIMSSTVVGVIIAAFEQSKSLVDDILMPLIGLVTPGSRAMRMGLTIGEKRCPRRLCRDRQLLIVSFVLYIFIVKFLGWIMKSKQQEAGPSTADEGSGVAD